VCTQCDGTGCTYGRALTPQPLRLLSAGQDPVTNSTEPNNLKLNERCGVANVTQAYDGAWGWSDTLCSETYVHICRIMRGWPCTNLPLRTSR
jgi:hypothetical protein